MRPPVLLVHHAANRNHNHPPNSIQALKTCLEAGARVIEVDISPLADGRFALLHGPRLEEGTTGHGPISHRTAAEVSRLSFIWKGTATTERIGLLEDALELVRRHTGCVELQLDLKPDIHFDDDVLSRLVTGLDPIKERVRVSSGADWVLRRLRSHDADLPLGFDPLLYLEVGGLDERELSAPPFRSGVFGYYDDHPLASRRWGTPVDYLAARAEALLVQAPAKVIWYVAAPLLAQALDDGFDWIAYLHDEGAEVVAWTLDPDQPRKVALARRLVAAGVDRITTNDAPALAARLECAALY